MFYRCFFSVFFPFATQYETTVVDDLRNLRYDSGAITRGRHARRLRYKTMSGRMDLI